MVLWELLFVLLLILANAFFAMSELAVISSRRAQLEAWAEEGRKGARTALALLDDSSRFLSTVQIGITLVGIFAGAFSGATFARYLADYFRRIEGIGAAADELALGVVVVTVTYLSLVVGELIPKQLALRQPERIAVWVARPMRVLARAAAPVVALLDLSTRLGMRLFGGGRPSRRAVTEEELKMLIREATSAGVVERAEQEMIAGVMRLGEVRAQALMTPRPDIVWIDLEDEPAAQMSTVRESGLSRLPVARGELDNVVGIVEAKDLLHRLLAGQPLTLEEAIKQPNIVPEGIDALHLLENLKASPIQMALIVDEYGSIEGLVTVTDILEAIVGELAEPRGVGEPEVFQRENGSWLMDGGLASDRLKDILGLRVLPGEEGYHTLAGFLLSEMARVPRVGEGIEWGGFRFEVVDMDGRRIDKVLIVRKSQLEMTGENDPRDMRRDG